MPGVNTCVLVIGVQRAPFGGMVYIFSANGSRIIRRIEVIDKVTSCCYVSPAACQDGHLGCFDGCVAVGTDKGAVFLLDLKLKLCKNRRLRPLFVVLFENCFVSFLHVYLQ